MNRIEKSTEAYGNLHKALELNPVHFDIADKLKERFLRIGQNFANANTFGSARHNIAIEEANKWAEREACRINAELDKLKLKEKQEQRKEIYFAVIKALRDVAVVVISGILLHYTLITWIPAPNL